MKVLFEEAKNFLESINEKDNIAIFTHTDLDGFVCGILFYDFCKKKECKKIDVFFIDYGKNKISDFDLKGKTKILISDLAQEIVSDDLKKIPKNIEIFYTDHHQSNKEVLLNNIYELRTTHQGYIPSSRTVFELVGGKYWLAVLGVLADFGDQYKENEDFIREFLKKEGKSLEYLKNDLMYMLSRAVIYFEKDKRGFFDLLKEINFLSELNIFREYSEEVKKEFDKYVEEFEEKKEEKNKIIFFYFEPKYNIKSLLINYLSSKDPKKIYVFLTPNEKNFINISVRNQSKEINLYLFLKKIVENLKNSSAGGHLNASGGQIMKEDLENFKKRLFSIKLKDFVIKNG